ncbi:MAG: hypothetical protein WCY88_12490 [Spongiibacteraceae bacterium]
MIEQRDEINFGMMDLAPFTEFEALVKKLAILRSLGKERSIVPMNTSEWHAYTSYHTTHTTFFWITKKAR